jgi:hypothetical protein
MFLSGQRILCLYKSDCLYSSRSRWPYGLRCGSAAARLLGILVRIQPWAGMSVVSVVCCQVEVSASGRSITQGSPTERSVSECDRGLSLIRRSCSNVSTCIMEERKSYGVHDVVTMLPNLSQYRQLHTFTIYVFKISFNIIFQYMFPHQNQFLLSSANLAVSPYIIGFWNRSSTTGHGSDNWKEICHYEFTLWRMSAAVASIYTFHLRSAHVCFWLFTYFHAWISSFLLFLVMSRGTDQSG